MADFKTGQLVWAKVKYYPPWPARVTEPPNDLKNLGKRNSLFVFFFGSNDYKFVEKKDIQDYFARDITKIKVKHSAFREACRAVQEYIKSSNYKVPRGGIRRENIPNGEQGDSEVSFGGMVEEKVGEETSPDTLVNKSLREEQEGRNGVPETPGCSRWSDGLEETVELTSGSQTDESDSTVMLSPLHIAFIGTGEISAIIVRRLRIAGHTVFTWDLQRKRVDAADIVRSSELIFNCQPDTDTARRTVLDEGGVVEGICPGKRFVEMSSTDTKTASDMAAAVRRRGGLFLEAVIVGSTTRLEEGSAGMLCAGDYQLMEECRHGLQALADKVEFLGAPGMAAQMAHILRVSQGGIVAAAAEAASIAQAEGLNMDTFSKVVCSTSLDSPLLRHTMKRITQQDFSRPLLKLQDLREDLTSMPAMAAAVYRTTPLTNRFADICTRALLYGHGKEYVSAVFTSFKR